MDRIRGQLVKVPHLEASGTMRVNAEMIPATPASDPRTLEQQVWGVADYVSEIVQQALWTKPDPNEKENQTHANREHQRGAADQSSKDNGRG
jgi:hypothetical protein